MKAQSQRRLRQLHNWIGLFFAPAILFFALSGSLQALGFQDRAAHYDPPAWMTLIANVHKHGVVRRDRKAAPTKPPESKAAPAKVANTFSLFAALLGLLLSAGTALGIWIAMLNRRNRPTSLLLLLAGIGVPVLLLLA